MLHRCPHTLPDAHPASHGLGKSGWVNLPMKGLELDLLRNWIEESYRAVAPKKLIVQRDLDLTAGPAPAKTKPAARRKSVS